MATALVVIDVQNAVLHGAAGPGRQDLVDAAQTEMVGRLKGVLERARAQGVPVYFVQHNEGAGAPLAAGSAGWEIRRELQPQSGEDVVQKWSCDSFHGTRFAERLHEAGIGRLVIGGNQTEFCVDTACRRAVGLGFDVTLLADGHMTGDSRALPFDRIVAHHTLTLDGFSAGDRRVSVASCAETFAG